MDYPTCLEKIGDGVKSGDYKYDVKDVTQLLKEAILRIDHPEKQKPLSKPRIFKDFIRRSIS